MGFGRFVLGGVLLGGLISLATALLTESRRDAASRHRDARERRIRELLDFQDSAEALAISADQLVLAMWMGETGKEEALRPDVGRHLSAARLHAQRVRDDLLEQRLDDLRKALAGAHVDFMNTHAERLKGLDKHERFYEYLKFDHPDRVESAARPLRKRVREIRDALDPTTG